MNASREGVSMRRNMWEKREKWEEVVRSLI